MARSHQLLVATVLGALLVQCAQAFTPPPAPRLKLRDGAVAFGAFTTAQSFYDSPVASDTQKSFAMFNGTSWSTINVNADRVLDFVQLPNGTIFFGGSFTTVNGGSCNFIASVDPDGTIRCLDQGLSSTVHALAWVNDELWIGGAFTGANGWYYAGEERLRYLAIWDGAFRPVPFQGVNNVVTKLFVDEYNRVWASGLFTATSDVYLPLTKVNIRNATSDHSRHNSPDPRVLIDETINDSAAQTWLAEDLLENAEVVVDLGVRMTVKRIDLRNTFLEGRGTHEVQFFCRSTLGGGAASVFVKTFNRFNAMEVSSTSSPVVLDRIPDLALQTFYTTGGASNCRYLTVRMTSSYGNGAGLSHVAVYTDSFVMATGPVRLPYFEVSTVGTWVQYGEADDTDGEALVGHILESNTARPSITFKPTIALAGVYQLSVKIACPSDLPSDLSCYYGYVDLTVATPGYETAEREIYNPSNAVQGTYYMAPGTTITITLPETTASNINTTVAVGPLSLSKQVTNDHAYHIAIYTPTDPSHLDLLDQQLPSGSRVNTIAFRFPNVYIGGLFTYGDATNILRYAGGELHPMAGNGLNGEVRTITIIDDNTLFVGGGFTSDANNTVNVQHGALYRDDQWHPVAGGFITRTAGQGVYSSTLVNGTDLVIVGNFERVYPADSRYPIFAPNVVTYNVANNTFHPMGIVALNNVLTTSNSQYLAKLRTLRGNRVMIAGSLQRSLGTLANNIVGIYGDRLQSLNGGFDSARSNALGFSSGEVYTAAWVDQTLYAGGQFNVHGLDNLRVARIARYTTLDGWQPLRQGLDNTVRVVVEIDNVLWVGGDFSRSYDPVTGKSQALRGLAIWNGTDFVTPFPQLGSGSVYTIKAAYANGKTYVFIGGSFMNAGTVVCNRICMWDGERWHALGLGVSNSVYAIEVYGSDVFVGGDFTYAGGIRSPYISRWNHREGTWTPLESPESGFETNPTSTVQSIAIVNSKSIFIGGSFGDNNFNYYLAHYDGERFTYFGNLTGGYVTQVKLWDTNNAVSGPDGKIPNGQSLLVIGGNLNLRTGPYASAAIFDGVNWRGVLATSTTNSLNGGLNSNGGYIYGFIDGPKPIGLEAYQVALISVFSVIGFLLIIFLIILFLVILPKRRAGGNSKPKKEKTPKAQKITDPEATSPDSKSESAAAAATTTAAAAAAAPGRPARPQSEAVRMSTFGGSVKRESVAKYDFTASEDNEISFRAGDVVKIIEDDDNDWWEGEANGQRGLFPAAYVE